MTNDTERLACMIPWGRARAISRAALAEKLGTSDRQMRKMIENARNEGLIVLNAQDGSGYYQSADVAELAAQYRQDTARAMAILKRRKHLRKVLKEEGVKV